MIAFRSSSDAVVVASGDLTLTEPAGAAQGDLLVAVISHRDTDAFTLPTDWVLVEESLTGDIAANSTLSDASGTMAYIIRGASAPDYTFVRTSTAVAIGCVAAYTGVDPVTPLDTHSKNKVSSSTTVTTGTITTTNPNALLVMGACMARNTSASGYTAATDPTARMWTEREDTGTATGSDAGVAIADAHKATAGATGTVQYTAGTAALHVCIVAAFNPAAETFTSKVVAEASIATANQTAALVSPSFTPAADSLLVVQTSLKTNNSNPTADFSISDSDGLTWTKRGSAIDNDGNASTPTYVKMETWTAQVTSSPSPMTVSSDHAATIDSHHLVVIEVEGHDAGSPIGATISTNILTETGGQVLSAAPDANSITVSALAASVGSAATASPGSLFTKLSDIVNGTALYQAVQVRYNSTEDNVDWSDAAFGDTIGANDMVPGVAIEIKRGGSFTAYTADLTAGAIAVTGTGLTVPTGRLASLTAGVIAVTGSALTIGRNADLTAGALAVTGSGLTVPTGRLADLNAGSISVTGASIDAPVGRPVSLTAGSVGLTGSGLTIGFASELTPGGIAVTGASISVPAGRVASLTAGAFSLSGSGLTASFSAELTPAAFSLTGSSLDAPTVRSAALTAGVIAVSGSTLEVPTGRIAALTTGVIAVTGSIVDDVYVPGGSGSIAYDADLTGGSIAVTGTSISVPAGRLASLTAGAVAVSGTALSVPTGRTAELTAGAIALTGADVTVPTGRNAALDAGVLTLSGGTLGVPAGRLADLAPGALSVTGSTLTVPTGRMAELLSGAFALVGSDLDAVAVQQQDYTADLTAGIFVLTGSTLDAVYAAGAVTITTAFLRAERVYVSAGHERTFVSPGRLRTFVSDGKSIL